MKRDPVFDTKYLVYIDRLVSDKDKAKIEASLSDEEF